jgi:trans-aconitate 2-methyltransferase
MDATAIGFSKTFDVVFSNAALHWVKDQIAVLKGVKAVLKPGGKILFQMGGYGNANDVFQVVNKMLRLSAWQRYFDGFIPPYHFYGVQAYKGWLEQCDFKILRVELISKDMKQQGKEGFKGWLRTTWFPYTDRLPFELRDIFLNDIIKTYLETHPMDSAGNIHVGMVRLEVEASAD